MILFAADPWEMMQQDVNSFVDPGWLLLAAFRLLVAALLGAVIGFQRQVVGKAAGLRTHMLVAMGAALFIVAPVWKENVDLSRVIQGILTGVGFIGGGAILKLREERSIKGLTTASTVWLTAAIGVTVGLGQLGMALVCTIFGLAILEIMQRLEPAVTPTAGEKVNRKRRPNREAKG